MGNNGKSDIILDITTEITRPKIQIDGAMYEMRVQEDFGLRDAIFLQDSGEKVKKLQDKGNLTKEEYETLSYLLDSITQKIIINLPDNVFKKLRDAHKIAILNAFIEAVGPIEGIPQQAGENQSLVSNDSMAEMSGSG